MVIDTSALIAILLGEPEANAIATAIARDNNRMLSAFSFLEASIVIEARKGESGGRELDLLLHHIQAEMISMCGIGLSPITSFLVSVCSD